MDGTTGGRYPGFYAARGTVHKMIVQPATVRDGDSTND